MNLDGNVNDDERRPHQYKSIPSSEYTDLRSFFKKIKRWLLAISPAEVKDRDSHMSATNSRCCLIPAFAEEYIVSMKVIDFVWLVVRDVGDRFHDAWNRLLHRGKMIRRRPEDHVMTH